MSDPATYQACSFRAIKTDDSGLYRMVIGRIRWRIAPELEPAAYIPDWEEKGYKTALNVPVGQSVRGFWYDGVALGTTIAMVDSTTIAEVTEIQNKLGTQDGYEWFVFYNPSPREYRKVWVHPDDDHTIEFNVILSLSRKTATPELIGAASRHTGANDSFSNGSMNSLWEIPPGPYAAV